MASVAPRSAVSAALGVAAGVEDEGVPPEGSVAPPPRRLGELRTGVDPREFITGTGEVIPPEAVTASGSGGSSSFTRLSISNICSDERIMDA
eukprot:9058196-Pyramimonas_sp.AAC.1